ncbi:MAG: hypothetical protein ACK55I_16500, partial [bacterium]
MAIGFGVDRGVGGPPVPAEPVEGPGKAQGSAPRRDGRHLAGRPRRVAGIARKARDAGHAVVLVIPGGQVLVGDGPVVTHAVKRAGAAVGGAEAGEMGAPEQRRAADRVIEEGLDGGVAVVDGIVGRVTADVGIGVVG